MADATKPKTGTLQSFYIRLPWIGVPLDFLERVTTARHWIGFADYVSNTIFRFLKPDSTSLARVLTVVTKPLGAWTARQRQRRGWFMRLDWATRKFVWSALWSITIAYRYRPRRAWKPRREKPINMVPPMERHADFQAETLRFPDAVPLAEATFGGDLWVEFLHLLQDIYPIVVPHLERAATDPETRLRESYPRMFQWIRAAPRWHPELVEAMAKDNLLGVLAVGGPFAKLLYCIDAGTGRYTIDLSHMYNYAVREGLMRLGCKINYQIQSAEMVVTDVVYAGESVKPGQQRWDLIQRIALASLVTHLTVWRQGMEYHASGLASFPAATHSLPPNHPIRRLMTVHMLDTTSTSYYTHLTLRRNGFDVTGFAFPIDVLFQYYNDGAREFDMSRLDIGLDKERRGIPDELDYPYYTQALQYYELFESYVRNYIDHYYRDEKTLAQDTAAHIWFDTLNRTIINGICGYVPALDKENLVKLCTTIIYSAVIAHEETSLWDYAVFMPTVVHEDGLPMTVGETQCVSNFQFLICSAINYLTNDFSHLALDAQGAAIMRQFQDALAEMQAEMQAGGDHYWRLYPNTLKSSVAC